MNHQLYTSANTSINSSRRPAIYGKLQAMGVFARPTLPQVIDYGCGRYFDEYGLGPNVRGYDPFNYDRPENLDNGADIAICSNVLNVVMEESVRRDILLTLSSLAPEVYITVYEGDKSGIGRPTKADCYQLNRKLKDYLPEIRQVFPDAYIGNGVIICQR